MEGGQTGGGGSGGPAPFLLKTYEMVDDSATDEIVSWSANKNSFVVWNPPDFAARLLPTYFKHNNFSSFIRQLNTYGFRKIDPEKWEFANEDFAKDQKHLLKNIYRRKPIHSHSHPQGSGGDAERAALEEEIEKLSREKTALQGNLWRFRQQRSGTKVQLEDLERRVQDMEQRQVRMMTFLAKAVENPIFVEHLVGMAGSFMDLSAINKRRRLPNLDYCQEVPDNSLVDDHTSSTKADIGHIFHQDFSSKLNLELSPAVSDSNLVYPSAQSSNEDGRSPQRKTSEGDVRDAQVMMEGLSFTPETFDLSDTGTSFTLKKDSTLSRQVREIDTSRLQCLPHGLTSAEEGDGHISCHLNLTLASSALQMENSHHSSRLSQLSPEIGTSPELRSSANGKEADLRVASKTRGTSNDDAPKPSSYDAPTDNKGPLATQGRVNDVFWEQFLTERPGSSDTEEASSSFRANPCDDQEEKISGHGKSWRNRKDMEQLTL
ncbi:heat stress transcription factor A-5-like [Telopea speciosissima]|uniref:heat stress transcription factor A-5-like n=1 Tax=Telopea speciosissima TaxID=54955 RepID=UPI001CC77236|nr:heat stress transcription factor A-5-like [Telopea speciosissima]